MMRRWGQIHRWGRSQARPWAGLAIAAMAVAVSVTPRRSLWLAYLRNEPRAEVCGGQAGRGHQSLTPGRRVKYWLAAMPCNGWQCLPRPSVLHYAVRRGLTIDLRQMRT